MAVAEICVCSVRPMIVACVRVIVVLVLGIEFVVAIQGQPGSARSGHLVLQTEPLVGVMLSGSDARFSFSGLVQAQIAMTGAV